MAWTIRVVICVTLLLSASHPHVLAQADAGASANARGEEAFRKALATLKSPNPAERAAAADEMGRRGYRLRKEIAEALRPVLLNDGESVVRAAAGRALGRLGAREAVPELVKALSDKSAEVRVVAAAALWRLPDPSAVPVLLERVRDTDKAVREWAALALGVAADPRAVPELVKLLKDPERPVRLAAVRSLGRLNRPEALAPLAAYLASAKRDDEEHDEVVTSVASIEGYERVTTLVGMLDAAAADPKQRLRLVLALGKVGDAQALPALRKVSQRDEAKTVRDAATQALAAVTGRSKLARDGGVVADAGRADAARSEVRSDAGPRADARP
jgi:HEAT repeat protein